jgi:hypothetical protein
VRIVIAVGAGKHQNAELHEVRLALPGASKTLRQADPFSGGG